MVSLRLLERCLPVLADHHERRQEDGFQRDDKGERGPRALLEDQHPDREERHMDVDEVHRPGKAVIASATRNCTLCARFRSAARSAGCLTAARADAGWMFMFLRSMRPAASTGPTLRRTPCDLQAAQRGGRRR